MVGGIAVPAPRSSATGPVRRVRAAIVLAAGKGTRMRSALPKALHPVGGRPMLEWVLDAARGAGCSPIVVVVGHGAESIREAVAGDDLLWVEQSEQLGTGHAVAQAEPALRAAGFGALGVGAVGVGEDRVVLVLSGDAPLVRAETLERLAACAEQGWGALAVARVDDPGSLGRVIQERDGRLARIVEVADANTEELAIDRVNSGHYALRCPALFGLLARVAPHNAQGELYLTDAVVAAAASGLEVRCFELGDACEAWGINDRADQARVHHELNRRHLAALMEQGVTVYEPDRVTVEASVTIASDCIVHPGVSLLGATRIASGCTLEAGAWLRDAVLAEGVTVLPYSVIDGAVLGAGASVGPFARLRPGTLLGAGAKVGNFVEVKAATLGPGVRASHLAYIGDATIGAGTNIGAGVVTCNYDGERKHRTEIGDNTFIGSDTMLVAPVKVGSRSITGAGSVITDEVPDDSLALGRARQRNLVGWSRRKRGK